MKGNFTEELVRIVQTKWKVTLILIRNSDQILRRPESLVLQLAKVWVDRNLCKGAMFNTEHEERFTVKADIQAKGSPTEKVQKQQCNI